MTRYVFPNLSNYEVIFNGRRFKAFKVTKSNPFEGFEENSDFVIWDGLYDAAVSCGTISSMGVYNGSLAFSHVGIEIEPALSINQFVKNSTKAQLRFFKDAGA